jgi:hypothetical protein
VTAPVILEPYVPGVGRNRAMPCPQCKQVQLCDKCRARIERVALRVAMAQGKQGELFE